MQFSYTNMITDRCWILQQGHDLPCVVCHFQIRKPSLLGIKLFLMSCSWNI